MLRSSRAVQSLSRSSFRLSTTGAQRFQSTLVANKKYLEVTHPDSPVPKEVTEALERHSTSLLSTYSRPPIIITHGVGSTLYDTQNRSYLDLSAGIAVNSLGHGDEQIVQLLAEQAGRLIHGSNVFHNEWAGELAVLLIDLTKQHGGLGIGPGTSNGGGKVFFANSGTEANEGALKFARKWAKDTSGKSSAEEAPSKFVCFNRAFHGRTMGTLSVTPNPKYQAPFAPLIPGVKIGDFNVHEGLEELISEDVCGVILEPVQGEGGVWEAEVEWIRAVVKRAKEVGAVVIFDEIQCGLFRSGSMWAHSKFPADCQPDIVTMAKPLANGIPIGAIMVRDEVAKVVTVGSHGTTFGGNPLSTRIGHHVLSRLSEPSLLSHISTLSDLFAERLARLPSLFPTIVPSAIRGRGLILGIPFKHADAPGRFVELCRERGVLLLTAGKDAVRVVPSLNVSVEDVEKGCEVMESVLVVMEQEGWGKK